METMMSFNCMNNCTSQRFFKKKNELSFFERVGNANNEHENGHTICLTQIVDSLTIRSHAMAH